MEVFIRIGPLRSLSSPRGRSSESLCFSLPSHARPYLFHPLRKSIIFSFPYSNSTLQLLSADDLPPPLTHDAFLTYQIPSLPRLPFPHPEALYQVQFIHSLLPSLPPSYRPPSLRLNLYYPFASRLLFSPPRRAHHCTLPMPCRYVSSTRSRLAAHFQSRIHATILISHAHLP